MLVVGDQETSTLYRFTVSGSTATVRGATSLGGAADVLQFWIDGRTVVGGDYDSNEVHYWKYPQGGAARVTISEARTAEGVVVSKRR